MTLTGALIGGACAQKTSAVQAPRASAQWRAAQSFVYCVEARASQCVGSGRTVAGWDAFFLLMWMGGGSPVTILEALPAALADHHDPRRVQRRFVDEVERYASSLRGAQCRSVSSQPIESLIEPVASVVRTRLPPLGLWNPHIETAVAMLVDDARTQLAGGSLVRLDCRYDPYRIYVATRVDNGRHSVVGMTTLLPPFLASEPLSREFVRERLQSRSLGLSINATPIVEGNVDAWLSVPIEDF